MREHIYKNELKGSFLLWYMIRKFWPWFYYFSE